MTKMSKILGSVRQLARGLLAFLGGAGLHRRSPCYGCLARLAEAAEASRSPSLRIIAPSLALVQAIDACAGAGGGTVTFSPGRYLTGALFVKSGMHLHLGEGVTLLGNHRARTPLRSGRAWPASRWNGRQR